MMKKNFIFMLLVLAFSACQKNEKPAVENDVTSIDFTAYTDRVVTRAKVDDKTTANLDTFRVACFQAGSAGRYFINEQKATKDGSVFKTSETYYWPSSASGQKLDFFAYCGTVPSGVNNNGGGAFINYTVPETADEDLIVSKYLASSKPSTGIVPLTFDHILSKVNSLVLAPVNGSPSANAKYKYIFTDVKISGVSNTGKYTFSTDAWGSLSGSVAYQFSSHSSHFQGDSSIELKTGSPAANDQLVILPQDDVTFSVTYSVEYSADGGSTWTEVMSALTKSTTIDMDKGYSYDITLHLPNSASEIIFGTVTVNDWTSGSADKTLE